MMISQNAIKQYKTPVDKEGGYRIYTVYKKENLFVFECWDCSLTSSDNSSVGTRKAYNEFPIEKEAVAEYEKYINTWEPKNRSPKL